MGVNGGRTVGGGRGRWELGEDRSMLVLVPMFMVIVVMLFVAITHSLMPNVSFINYVRMEWCVPLQLNPLNPIHPFHSISIPFHTSKFHTIHLIFVSISFIRIHTMGRALKGPRVRIVPPVFLIHPLRNRTGRRPHRTQRTARTKVFKVPEEVSV